MTNLTLLSTGTNKNWHQDRVFLNDSTDVRCDPHNRSVLQQDRALDVVVERDRP